MSKCQKCQKDIPKRIFVNDQPRRVSHSRKFCFECSPLGKYNKIDIVNKRKYDFDAPPETQMKICSRCRKDLTLDNFYRHVTKNGQRRIGGYCKSCHHILTLEQQRNFKRKCVNYKGGKCEDCGFDGHAGVFDFHHKDPTQKDITISRIKSIKLTPKVIAELDKCALLCANCHRMRHVSEHLPI